MSSSEDPDTSGSGSTESKLILKHDAFYDEQGRRCQLECSSTVFTIVTFIHGVENATQSIEYVAANDVIGMSTVHGKDCLTPFPDAKSDDMIFNFSLCEKTGAAASQSVSIRKRRDVRFRLRMDTKDEMDALCTAWYGGMRQLTCRNAEKAVLVIINPYSGSRDAPNIFNGTIKPVLEAARIRYDKVETSRAGHAEHIAFDTSLCIYHGILIVSGDGLIHEVINGLVRRSDWKTTVRMPLAALPGGSINSMAAVITKLCGEDYLDRAAMPLTSAYVVAKHSKLQPVDALLIETEAWRKYAFMASACCGLFRDTLVENETMRWMPLLMRMAFLVLKNLSIKTVYRGKIQYLPDTEENRSLYFTNPEDTLMDPNVKIILPPIDEPLPSNWCSIEDDFVSLDVASCYHGKAEAVADGRLYLSIIKGCTTRWDVMKFLSRINTPDVERPPLQGILRINILAYRLTLATPATEFALDGEIVRNEVPQSIIQAEIRPGTFRFMSK